MASAPILLNEAFVTQQRTLTMPAHAKMTEMERRIAELEAALVALAARMTAVETP